RPRPRDGPPCASRSPARPSRRRLTTPRPRRRTRPSPRERAQRGAEPGIAAGDLASGDAAPRSGFDMPGKWRRAIYRAGSRWRRRPSFCQGIYRIADRTSMILMEITMITKFHITVEEDLFVANELSTAKNEVVNNKSGLASCATPGARKREVNPPRAR